MVGVMVRARRRGVRRGSARGRHRVHVDVREERVVVVAPLVVRDLESHDVGKIERHPPRNLLPRARSRDVHVEREARALAAETVPGSRRSNARERSRPRVVSPGPATPRRRFQNADEREKDWRVPSCAIVGT
jgi:hypothetical protein